MVQLIELNDKVNKLDNEIKKVDEKVGQLEMKIYINHAIVINRLGVLEGQLGSFIKYQTRFNVTVEQKMQVFNQTTNDHDLAIKRVEKVADRHCEQILELHKMVDWTKAEIRNGCNCDVISQFDQLNNKIDKVSETLTDKFNSEIDNVSKIVQDRLNFQNDKVVKLDDKFSDLVQHAVMSLKTEVVTVKHSVDSKSVDVALCKSRLDVVDKNLTDVITKLKHIPIKKIAMCIKVVKIYIQMKINNLCQYLFLVTPLENKFLAQVNAGWWTLCLVVLHNPRQAFAGLGWTVLKITQAQFRKLFLLVKFKLVTHWVIWITVKMY